jgi:hypothetical protein
VLWSVVAAAVAVYLVATVVVYVSAIATHEVPEATSSNGYVGFLMWDMVFAAPVFVLFFWWVTVPLVLALGTLAACVRSSQVPGAGDEPVAAERKYGSG